MSKPMALMKSVAGQHGLGAGGVAEAGGGDAAVRALEGDGGEAEAEGDAGGARGRCRRWRRAPRASSGLSGSSAAPAPSTLIVAWASVVQFLDHHRIELAVRRGGAADDVDGDRCRPAVTPGGRALPEVGAGELVGALGDQADDVDGDVAVAHDDDVAAKRRQRGGVGVLVERAGDGAGAGDAGEVLAGDAELAVGGRPAARTTAS